jgi:hypothetical protein
MGRFITKTTTTKAVITGKVPDTLSAVYTNNTNTGAELTDININGVGDITEFSTDTGGSGWTFFGNSINPLVQANAASSTGFGTPYPVELSNNRVLIFFLPHFQHRGGEGQDFFDGNKVHCQILEYQTNKYVAGPITTVELPTSPFTDTVYSLWSRPNNMLGAIGNNCWKAVALTPNKVAVVYRVRGQFRLVRFTITGNTVDFATSDLDLTGPTFFNTVNSTAFAIDTVPGDTNKVVVGGEAPSNFSIQAFNVPDTGPLSSATGLTATGIPTSNHHFGLSRMVKTPTANVTPYLIAAATSATARSAVIFNFNSATNTFTISGTIQALPAAASQHTGLECACMSSDTSVNAVIAATDTGNAVNISFFRQTSDSSINNTPTSLSLQHSTAKGIVEHHQWGDERVVFTGDTGLLVVYDSAGTATNLLPATETINTNRYLQQWIPFISRPLYNLQDQAQVFTERTTHWISRTNNGTATGTVSTTGTDVGVSTLEGNYFPYGFDYGLGYAWNEQANCWIIGQGGRLYSLDTDGVIRSEISVFNLSPLLNWEYSVRQVGCTPSGRILFNCEYRSGTFGGGATNCWNTWNNFSGIMYVQTTNPVLTPEGLANTVLEDGPTNISQRFSCNLVTFVEGNVNRTERAVLLTINTSPTGQLAQWTQGTGWANTGATSIPTTTDGSAWHRGFNPNFRIIQDTPVSAASPRGLWRIIGSVGLNTSANYRLGGFSNPADITVPSGMSTSTNIFDNTQTSTFGYSLGYSRYASGDRASVEVITMYDQTRGVNRVWSSINGRLRNARGYFPTALNLDLNRRYAKPIATKFGFSVIYQNTSVNNGTGIAVIWDTINPVEPRFTHTTNVGSGQIISYPISKVQWQHVGDNVDITYSVSGIPDDVKLFVVLDDNSGNAFSLNEGQVLNIVVSNEALFRSVENYSIPPGFSIKLRADTPNSLSTMLTIKENL